MIERQSENISENFSTLVCYIKAEPEKNNKQLIEMSSLYEKNTKLKELTVFSGTSPPIWRPYFKVSNGLLCFNKDISQKHPNYGITFLFLCSKYSNKPLIDSLLQVAKFLKNLEF